MLDHLGILLEVPMSRKEARSRQLPDTVGRLVLYAVEKTKETRAPNMSRLSRWLWRWGRDDESLYASPIVPEKTMASFLASAGLGEDTEQLDVQTYLIRCESENAIRSILQDCTSEAIVFLTDTDGCSARETLVAVENYAGDYRGHETPFMCRLAVHGGFFFFAETHQSLEVLGTEDFIRTRCLGSLCDETVRATTPTAAGGKRTSDKMS